MKDYYYILGLNINSTNEDIRKAYRKLSVKFHPDKNDGDPFFAERFKDVQEAYETLIDPIKKREFDIKFTHSKTKDSYSYEKNYSTFTPEILVFKTNKNTFEFGEEITFTWKTINADRVSIEPFGKVQPIGQKTYKIRNFKDENINFVLVAENSFIQRGMQSVLTLENKTYKELYRDIYDKIKQEEYIKRNNDKTTQNDKGNNVENNSSFAATVTINILIVLVLIFLVIYLS